MNAAGKDAQDDVELLLPWHAAGSLSRDDAARVERALANDNELARRYDLVREELGESIRLNESLGAPSAQAMRSLFARIDAEPARKAAPTLFNFSAWIASLVAGLSPRTLAFGATAAALAIVLQAGLLIGAALKDATTAPQLASYEEGVPADQGAFLLIRFNPKATAAEITRFLQENKATVVGGPAAGSGFYRLKVAEAPLSTVELGTMAKRMQTNPVVGFTVPAAP